MDTIIQTDNFKTVSLTISKHRFHYFKIRVVAKTSQQVPTEKISLEPLSFRALISQALEVIHGVLGSGINVDVLQYNKDLSTGIIRVPQSEYEKVWQSLTMFRSKITDRDVKFEVLANSVTILGLSHSTRAH